MAGTLSRLAAWAVATALAVTLSWFAVSDVLAGETLVERPASAVALDPPTARPGSPNGAPLGSPSALPGPPSASSTPATTEALTEAGTGDGSGSGAGTGPASPGPAVEGALPRSPGPAEAPRAGTGTSDPAAFPPSTATPTPAAAGAPAAQSYQLDGGRVVIETTEVSARLVSATPEPGWTVQAWQAEGWLRVDFSRDGRTSSCFVTWNGHPPSVQIT
ncbi:hypothetical protein MXD63_09885 [Frankia sp. Cpl3]|nr:hypothetical protein [Parafrankia colletiae]MCK9900382.1 hypothetical protein [Frankia sp. Cpl3]